VFPGVDLAYVVPPRTVLKAAPLDRATEFTELSSSPVVEQTACPRSDRSSVLVVARQAFAVAAYPECSTATGLLGKVVAVIPLDRDYLDLRRGDNGPTFALYSRTAQLASSSQGRQPPASLARRLASAVLDDPSRPASAITASSFVAARPVLASDGTSVLALVGSTPTSTVASTRDALFRTLFLIALVGTLLALFLAALVGDRIGAGLRRLTAAAESIRRGQLGVRAAIDSQDEVGVLGSAFDSMVISIEDKTSALREAAEEEAALRNRLEAVVAGMGDALVAVDATGSITDFNRAAEELTGTTAASACTTPVEEVLKLRAEDGTDLGARLRTPSPSAWGAIATVAGGNGARVPVAVSAGALRGPDSQLAGNVLVLRDLRRERQLERMKTEFLARASHELRTPLTPILGYAESMLQREMNPESRRTALIEIVQASKRLLRTVKILEFVATAEAGRLGQLLRLEQLDLRGLVNDVVERWAEAGTPHTLVRRVSRQLPSVTGNRRWLSFALDELVDNAVKFSPAGGRIVVTASRAQDGRDGVTISVADTGRGMTDEEQAQCFGDFVQGDASDTRAFGGLGLGLGLVKRVAEGHGGEVWCESELNQGSRFTIFLPARDASA
jgi:PAS domain S-box-containing protein